MTVGGSAWDRERADASTARLPYLARPDETDPYGDGFGRDGYGPYGDDAGYGGGPYDPPPGWPPPRRRRRWRLLRRAIALLLILVTLGVLAFGGLLLVTPSVGNAPELAQAQDLAHHVVYPGPPVARRFAASLVATEDHRFYSEPGIDPFAIARVIAATVTGQGDQGGATIDQQLAKMLYTSGRSGPRVEAEQVALAVKLFLTYRRPQILRMYADVAYFGHGYYGLSAASCGYFGTTPAGLSWPKAALLAGLVQGPSADDPIAHYARARARELHVLSRLVATGVISQAQATAGFRRPLRLVGGSGSGCHGPH